MDSTVRGTVEMTAAMVILGTIGWFVVMSGEPIMDVVFWRCAFGAITLLIICAALGLLRGRLSLRIVAIAALGGAAIVINWLLLFSSFSRASISIATAVYNTQPFMLVGFGALFFSERLTMTKLAWLGIAFAGMLLIVQASPDAVRCRPQYRHRQCRHGLFYRHRDGAGCGFLLGRRRHRHQEAQRHAAAPDRPDPGLRRRRHPGTLRQPFPPSRRRVELGACWRRLASSIPV